MTKLGADRHVNVSKLNSESCYLESHPQSCGWTCQHVQVELWMLISSIISTILERINMSTCPSWTLNDYIKDLRTNIQQERDGLECWYPELHQILKNGSSVKWLVSVKHFVIINRSSVKRLESAKHFMALICPGLVEHFHFVNLFLKNTFALSYSFSWITNKDVWSWKASN